MLYIFEGFGLNLACMVSVPQLRGTIRCYHRYLNIEFLLDVCLLESIAVSG